MTSSEGDAFCREIGGWDYEDCIRIWHEDYCMAQHIDAVVWEEKEMRIVRFFLYRVLDRSLDAEKISRLGCFSEGKLEGTDALSEVGGLSL